jgi:hypothetical protein
MQGIEAVKAEWQRHFPTEPSPTVVGFCNFGQIDYRRDTTYSVALTHTAELGASMSIKEAGVEKLGYYEVARPGLVGKGLHISFESCLWIFSQFQYVLLNRKETSARLRRRKGQLHRTVIVGMQVITGSDVISSLITMIDCPRPMAIANC